MLRRRVACRLRVVVLTRMLAHPLCFSLQAYLACLFADVARFVFLRMACVLSLY